MSHRSSLSALVLLSVGPALAQTPPVPTISGVVNSASFLPSLSPGVLAGVFGQNLGPMFTCQSLTSCNPPGLTVTVGGRRCFVFFSSPTQLSIQFPVDLPVGPSQLIVDNQGSRSVPFAIRIDPVSPGILTFAGQLGAFVRSTADGRQFIVTSENPANPGDGITFYGTGFGPTNPVVPDGQVTPPQPLARTTNQPTLRIGDRVVSSVLFSGLAPGIIGTYQIVFALPSDLPPGNHVFSAEIAGFISNKVLLPVAVVGLGVTQSGFTITAVQGGGQPSPRSFRVINGTQRLLNYTLAATTFNGGNWLSVSSTGGSIPTAGAFASIDVRVDPSSLSAGDYYGQIRVEAPNVPNSPRFLSVVLNVVAPNVNPGPTVDPTGLVFVGLLNGQNQAAQAVRITNLTARPSPFTASAAFEGGRSFFTFSPASGTVSPGQPASVSIQPTLAGLPAGVYRGALTLLFPQDNTSRVIDVVLVVTPALNLAASEDRKAASSQRAADACTPTKLVPVFASLGSNFSSTVAWPSAVEMIVVDDCGSALRTGTVQVTFSNGDPPLALVPQQDGRWSATWTPRNARNDSLRITGTARLLERRIEGTVQIGGSAQANDLVPTVNIAGVVSAGSYSAAPSPGELISIFGARLADGLEGASSLPLPTRLQNTQVLLGGRLLPLVFTSDGQVNAVIPYDVPVGTVQQIVVRRGNRISVPEPVAVQSAQPAVFTVDQSGRGQGHIYFIPGPGEQVLADTSRPAKEGDFVVIYCTGLGPVDPPVTAGTATPSDTLRRVAGLVTVTIGGVAAPVDFAGLTPGFTGLYQINTRVPAGVSPAAGVPVVISVGGNPGPVVTMAIQ